MNTWFYDPAINGFVACEREYAMRVSIPVMLVYRDGGELRIRENGVVRRWRPGESIVLDGVRYRLPKVCAIDVLHGGYAAPWRVDSGSTWAVGDNCCEFCLTTTTRHEHSTICRSI